MRNFLVLSLLFFVSIFISLFIGLHILTNNPTPSYCLPLWNSRVLFVYPYTSTHKYTHALEGPGSWGWYKMDIITVKHQETDSSTKISREGLGFYFFFMWKKVFHGWFEMKTSKFYLGSQALLMLHWQYFPMQSNQLHMCPEQKCKCASFRSVYFRYMPVSVPFHGPFNHY